MKNKKMVPTLRFSGFTDAWEQRKLNEISEIIGGGTPSTVNPDYWDGDIDWYAPAEMEGQIYARGSIKKITEIGLQNSSAKVLPAHRTVLFTSRAGIGKMAILQRSGATNQGFQSMVLKDEYNPYFVYSMGSVIKKRAEGIASGSTFLEISGKTLGNLEIMVPNKTEQDAIAKYFESIDNLITLHQRKLEKIKNIKKAYLQIMFPKEGEKYPKLRFYGFTEPWEERELRECCEIYNGDRGINYPNEKDIVFEGIPFINAGDLKNGRVHLYASKKITREKYSQLGGVKLQLGDIVYCLRGTLGKNAFIDNFDEGTVASSLAALRPKNIDGKYLFHILNSDIEFRQRTICDEGAAQPNLSAKSLSGFVIPIPKIEEQIKISGYLDSLDNLITLHQRKLEKLQNIKKAYLNELFL